MSNRKNNDTGDTNIRELYAVSTWNTDDYHNKFISQTWIVGKNIKVKMSLPTHSKHFGQKSLQPSSIVIVQGHRPVKKAFTNISDS